MLTPPCSGQSKSCMAGLDLTSLLNRQADIQLAYGFVRHWSITGEAVFCINGQRTDISPYEKEHLNGFTESNATEAESIYHQERLLLHYWPEETFKGISLSFGVQTSAYRNIGLITRIGYTFEIWKGLCMSSSLQLHLDNSPEGITPETDNIRIGIHYKF